MKKSITIIRGFRNESYDEFHSRVREIVNRINKSNPVQLHYTITLEKPPRMSVIPFSKEKIALISVRGEKEHLQMPEELDAFSGSFSVTEALPIAYTKDWEDGEATPGICLLTLFRKKKGLDEAVFIDKWFNGHTPLTLKIHPIYHYNRNKVNEGIGDPPVWYDGIVEEHCKTRKELLNPFRFFAKSGFALVNMIKTYFDVNGFIDYKSIETYLVREYHIIS